MLHSVKLSTAIIAAIRDLAKEMGVHLQSYSDTKVLTETINKNVTFYCEYVKNEYELLSDIAAEGLETYTISLIKAPFSVGCMTFLIIARIYASTLFLLVKPS